MNERETAALSAILRSKKYAPLPEDTVRRAFLRALSAHRNLKDADKAARGALHQMCTMFFSENERKRAYAFLDSGGPFDRELLFELFKCHASSRERLKSMDALYDRVFARVGERPDVVDYACGLNPLYLGMRGIPALGLDIHRDAVMIVNRWAREARYPVKAEVFDILSTDAYPEGTLALAMKLLPVLEREKRGFAREFLLRVKCGYLLATFPTRTLGARSVGMEAHYSDWFLAQLPERFAIMERFVIENELCYLLEVKNA